MGCIQSRKDINDVHPNVFRVFNVDNCGNCLWAGQLEVTETELVLYRRGQQPTRWPLICLRRYGFDTDMFSFESGRRCQTGEGIFAFKCRRAEQLFKVLQQHMKNNSENILEALSSETPRITGLVRQIAPPSEYLEPAPAPPPVSVISRFPSNMRMGYVSTGPLSPEVHSPGSPSSSNILEVMPLAPLPTSATQVTNLYQFQDFPLQREHNNNKKVCVNSNTHLYSNDVNSDLAMLRQTMQSRQTLPDDLLEEAMAPLAKEEVDAPLSPTLSGKSDEHYATLVVEKVVVERLYMNVNPSESTSKPLESSIQTNYLRNHSLETPITTDNIDKINDFFTFTDKTDLEEGKHNYANLSVTEVKFDPRSVIRQRFKHYRGSSLDTPLVYEDNTKMKYAILDLHNSKSSDTPMESIEATTPGSPKDLPLGYITIDFNKTGALKSVSQSMEIETEGLRKTRHNSTAQPPDPNVT